MIKKGNYGNPDSAKLAEKYAKPIIEMLKGSQAKNDKPSNDAKSLENFDNKTQELEKQKASLELPKHFQENEKDWELTEEDLEALKELPL